MIARSWESRSSPGIFLSPSSIDDGLFLCFGLILMIVVCMITWIIGWIFPYHNNALPDSLSMKDKHICPWWLAYTFDNPLRRYFHDPHAILKPYLQEGMTAIDLGCGMGYFSRAMAKIVGETGKVIAVDLQHENAGYYAQACGKGRGGASHPVSACERG